MAKTYRPEAIATSEKDQVRFLIGDNTVGPPNRMVLDDDEILWLISQEANVYMAAATAADSIVAVMNGQSDAGGSVTRKRVGQTDISYANGRTAKEYAALAVQLRRRSGHRALFAGGISVSDKYQRAVDTDRPGGRLRLNQFDAPGTSLSDSTSLLRGE